MRQLNPSQLQAVKYIDSPLLVLAGAGSGKTSVITQKIAYLISACGLKACNIAALNLHGGNSFNDVAVLYRGNHQAKLLEIKLQAHQIPYQITGATSFFSRSEIKDLMAYLRLLINPDDDNALLRIINTPRRKIGPSILETLGNYATERGISLLAACSELGLSQHHAGQAKPDFYFGQ